MQTAQAYGVRVVLASIPFLAERFVSGVFLKDSSSLPYLEEFVAHNNQKAKDISKKYNLPFVDTSELVKEEFLFDDCHFLPIGEVKFAELAGNAIKSLIHESELNEP